MVTFFSFKLIGSQPDWESRHPACLYWEVFACTPSAWQLIKRCDEVAQPLQLVLRHNYLLDSVALISKEIFERKVLLQPFEERFDLPTSSVVEP